MKQHAEDVLAVVVPVYNAERYLDQCVSSVLAQRMPSGTQLRLFLVNDGSTDSSPRLCHKWAATDSRVSVISKENGGLSSARNAGIDVAVGLSHWIYFTDADDILPQGALECLVKINRRTSSPMVVGDFAREKDPAPQEVSYTPALTQLFDSDTFIRHTLYQNILGNHSWGVLYEAPLFKELRFRNCWYEDLDFFYRVADAAGRVAFSPQALYLYRVNPESFIENFSEGRFDCLDVTDRIADYVIQTRPAGSPLVEAAQDRRFSAHYNVLGLLWRTGKESEYPSTERRCLQVVRSRRWKELIDPGVRLKNKVGAILALLPLPIMKSIVRRFSKP